MTMRGENDPHNPTGAVEKHHEVASGEPLTDRRGLFASLVVPSCLNRNIVTLPSISSSGIPDIWHVARFFSSFHVGISYRATLIVVYWVCKIERPLCPRKTSTHLTCPTLTPSVEQGRLDPCQPLTCFFFAIERDSFFY